MTSTCAIIISADIEWRAWKEVSGIETCHCSPFGEWYEEELPEGSQLSRILFFQGGWGKISAAASTQHVIDRWNPAVIMVLGTCGGIESAIDRGTLILAERTIVYDISDLMGDQSTQFDPYCTIIDLSWLEPDPVFPQPVIRTTLVSADRDLAVAEIPWLHERFAAVAADWESGAIAWVAGRNQVKCLILKAVSDVVGPGGGEAYQGSAELFESRTREIMRRFHRTLPKWLRLIDRSLGSIGVISK
jgi:adenosylhomocysteine nucleosidase